MSSNMLRKYSDDETAQGRDTLIRTHILPYVEMAFAANSHIQCAVMFIAQYWCDEADDAVQVKLAFGLLPDPDIQTYLNPLAEDENCDVDRFDSQIFIEGRPCLERLKESPEELENLKSVYSEFKVMSVNSWPANDKAISFFAAFCLENNYESAGYGHDNVPYAVFTRRNKSLVREESVNINIVGTMHRPWLEGIAPEVEHDAMMAGKIALKLLPPETAAGRRETIDNAILPMVKKAFDQYSEFQSAVFLVAQFWCDEARDAVHRHVAFSLSDNPDIEGWLAYITKIYEEDTKGEDHYYFYEYMLEGKAGLEKAGIAYNEWGESPLEDLDYEYCMGWDGNDAMIPLFASYCKESGDQEKSIGENYAPYAVFTRGSDGAINHHIIGQAYRPWLDGVMPEWEVMSNKS